MAPEVVELAEDEAFLSVGADELGLGLARQTRRLLDPISVQPVIQVPEFPTAKRVTRAEWAMAQPPDNRLRLGDRCPITVPFGTFRDPDK